MSLSTQPYKGSRDFYPADKRVLDYIFSIWRKSCLSYGYEQYDAPLIEPAELYVSKSSSEIVNEQTYIFTDRGKREVVIRPEMTPSVSRMVAAKRQELAYPLRLFSTPNVWRYERPQRGRLREHWQLNADLFGLDGLNGDYEIIMLADTIMQNFGASRESYNIKISSRKLVNYLLADYLKLEEVERLSLIRLIDKRDKMSQESFTESLSTTLSGTSAQDSQITDRLIEILNIKSLHSLPEIVKEHSSFKEIVQLEDMLNSSGVTNAGFDISLMRGFDYYTDIVFEVFDTDPSNNRSLFGGGRYDGLVGLFGVEPLPTVGFGMGDVTIRDFLETHKLLPELSSEIDAVVIPIGINIVNIQGILKTLRDDGARLAVDSSDKKIDKKIKNASKMGVKHVVFIGQDELVSKVFKVKNLETGEEINDEIMGVSSIIQSSRWHKNTDEED
jgi:histidyl-tRNA synthetase